MKTVITKDSLIAYGMIETGDIVHPLEKVIVAANDNNDDVGPITIAVTMVNNVSELCMMLPDGSCLYLSADSIETLKTIEGAISGWESRY